MSGKLKAFFTRRARHALAVAQETANQSLQGQIEPEHLLIGLVSEERTTAVHMLRTWGAVPHQVIRAVRRGMAYGDRPFPEKPALAPQTKQIIELSVEEARQMGDSLIHTEHLLLALVRAGDGLAVRVLQVLGVDIARVRAQTPRPPAQGESDDGSHGGEPS
jgi:ATP-dependent Clp protease ATP-binding subunit ClpC